MPYRKEYGLFRRCAPRNDSGGGPCTRRRATVFCMSLRASAHTGVAIRSPRRETWQAGCCLGKFVTPYVFALSAAFCHVLPQGLRIATSLRSSQ